MSYTWLGTVHAWRTRGKETLQPFEQPLKIAVMGAPAAHYLGLSSGWSVALGALFLIAWETSALLAGRFDYKAGVLEEQQRQLNAQDPFKVEVLRILRQYQRAA